MIVINQTIIMKPSTKTGFSNLRNGIVCFTFLLFQVLSNSAFAQQPMATAVQTIRGIVSDQVLQSPIPGATVRLPLSNISTTTDANGAFKFNNIPLGIQQINVTSVGYKEIVLDNVAVNAGKEVVLNINLENSIVRNQNILIKANSRKNKPLNEMSLVSARAFTVEETQKYAAAVNDPSRMATGFPGVVSTDDGNNNIAIRGNSPTGLLWRMEGEEIPNPNHFSSTGGSGGGISILSAQLLANSDFVTGAFAADYGNALSGVFDLRLRKGNNEKREYTLQAGFLGLNAAAEGPFMPFYKGSYLINYRYSTLQLLSKMGLPVSSGATNFQDLSYNFYFPTKRFGQFSFFGLGGLSSQASKAQADSSKWQSSSDRFTSNFISNTGASGITHTMLAGSKTNIRTALVLSYNRIKDEFNYTQDDLTPREDYNDSYRTKKLTVSTTINHKVSARTVLRGGAILNFIGFNYFQQQRDDESAPLEQKINVDGRTKSIQGFGQWQYKLLDRFVLNGGVHYLRFLYNSSQAVEPRASAKWQINRRNSLAFAYGQHSQIQALGVYFAEAQSSMGNIVQPNKDLDLSKARHYVVSYHHNFSSKLALKLEAYYQHLYKIPVSSYDTSSFSMLNVQSEYITEALVSKGKGKNYGVELSLEKYLSNNLYYTVSTSLYSSKYTGADGKERNTKFNGNYVANLVMGKEFVSANKRRSFGINVKAIAAGGLRTTPIDLGASQAKGKAVYNEHMAFASQNPDYFRTDLRLSMKWNRKHLTSTLSLDIQNVSNRMNVYGQWYDDERRQVVTTYQTGLIPVLNYKVEF